MTDRLRRAGVVFALTSLAACSEAAAQEQAQVPEQTPTQTQEQAVIAVWKAREVDFLYRSSVAIFSCSALQDRVIAILRGVGARDDVQVRVDDCGNSFLPSDAPSHAPNTWDTGNASNTWPTPSSRFSTQPTARQQTSHVRARVMWPTEVTQEILGELDRDKSRRELVSRVTGNPAAMLDDPVAFKAKRQAITLSHKTIGLDPVECELLEQMSTSVFRELGIRVVRRSSSCGRNSVSRIPPQMTVESLIGIPFAAQQMPSVGDDPSAPAASDTTPAEPTPATTPK